MCKNYQLIAHRKQPLCISNFLVLEFISIKALETSLYFGKQNLLICWNCKNKLRSAPASLLELGLLEVWPAPSYPQAIFSLHCWTGSVRYLVSLFQNFIFGTAEDFWAQVSFLAIHSIKWRFCVWFGLESYQMLLLCAWGTGSIVLYSVGSSSVSVTQGMSRLCS